MKAILEVAGVTLFWLLPFLPFLAWLLLIKETKKLRFTLITVGALIILFALEILIASTAKDFHVAAFLVQLFMPAQLIFTAIVLTVGNLVIVCRQKRRVKVEAEE